MYQYVKEEKPQNKREKSESMKVPELKSKTYSFADPLLQSFGNHNHQGVKNFQNNERKPESHRTEKFNVNDSKFESELFFELEEVSERVSLMEKMLKINKAITNPSILFVNSQNKVKTEMLIENKRLNQDENSIILCENATKYLTFLSILNEEENQYQFGMNIHKNERTDANINLEFRVENQYQSENERSIRENKRESVRHKEPYQSLKESNLEFQKYPSSKEKTLENQSQERSYEDSTHINFNPKTTNFSSGLSTAEKMFQGIKTPQISENQAEKVFTPFRHQKHFREEFTNFEPENRKEKNLKSPQSSAVLQVKKVLKNPFEQEIHTFNKKINQTQSKSSISTQKNAKIEASRSKSKNEKSNQNTIKEKKERSSKDLSVTKRNRAFSNFESMMDSKNLVYKTLDKTSQFDKMLKMASSRINQN